MSRRVTATVRTEVAATASRAHDAHHGHSNFGLFCPFAIVLAQMQLAPLAFHLTARFGTATMLPNSKRG
jgi:hypothetical protein